MVSTTNVYNEVFVVDQRTSKARTFRLEGENLDLLVLPNQIRAIRDLWYGDIVKCL